MAVLKAHSGTLGHGERELHLTAAAQTLEASNVEDIY